MKKEVVRFLLNETLMQAYFSHEGPANDNYYKIMDHLDKLAILFGVSKYDKFGMMNKPIKKKRNAKAKRNISHS